MPRWLLVLLAAVPLALVGRVVGWPSSLVFLLAAIGLIPLAGLIGTATEVIAEHTGQRIGGLLNATFGNAAELIIGVTALAAGLTDVVRASITGSIIGNALLVLGMSMFVGGWRHGVQRFNARHAGQYASLLVLAVGALALPSLVSTFGAGSVSGQKVVRGMQLYSLSLVVAVILLICYLAYLAFSVFNVHAGPNVMDAHEDSGLLSGETHRGEEVRRRHDSGSGHAARRPQGDAKQRHTKTPAPYPATGAIGKLTALWERSPWPAVGLLAVVTAVTAVVSESLVATIEPVGHQLGLSPFFIGLIIVPIVGNAAEHSTAVTMAARDRMEVTMAITAGSSIQVALLVAPLLVLVSGPLGHPLDLNFVRVELVIFGVISLLYALVSLDGESTWLEGLQLCAFYLIVAVVAFFVPS